MSKEIREQCRKSHATCTYLHLFRTAEPIMAGERKRSLAGPSSLSPTNPRASCSFRSFQQQFILKRGYSHGDTWNDLRQLKFLFSIFSLLKSRTIYGYEEGPFSLSRYFAAVLNSISLFSCAIHFFGGWIIKSMHRAVSSRQLGPFCFAIDSWNYFTAGWSCWSLKLSHILRLSLQSDLVVHAAVSTQ